LLIEAVSLLVQRQRETEAWVSEQICHADERAAATERQYAELEARLKGIEDRLMRLTHESEPGRSDPATDERLARLREQVQGLKTGPDERPARRAAMLGLTAADETPSSPAPETRRPNNAVAREPEPPRERPVARRVATLASQAQSATFWELLGATPQDRFGVVLIGLGAIAVLYAILTQLHFG
ncbi:MAG TPA: hypothetical protein VF937_06285, partial [Chloroflexota bacterium]